MTGWSPLGFDVHVEREVNPKIGNPSKEGTGERLTALALEDLADEELGRSTFGAHLVRELPPVG